MEASQVIFCIYRVETVRERERDWEGRRDFCPIKKKNACPQLKLKSIKRTPLALPSLLILFLRGSPVCRFPVYP